MKTSSLLKELKAFVLILCLTSFVFSQSVKAPIKEDSAQKDLALERATLISELQSLERETLRFNDSLAKALADAEIADAAWQLDRDWAKKLLRDAYELVLPKANQSQRQDRPAGAIPPTPNSADRSRQKVRQRVLEIARRDKDLANELIQMEQESLGVYGKQYASAVLADQSLMAGDNEASADYILQGIEADPSQGTAPSLINGIALRDRALANRLILKYIEALRRFPIDSKNQSDIRIFIMLAGLVSPYLIHDPDVKILPPSLEVMRSYISYMLEALSILEQKESGYLLTRRRILLSLWVPLQQYAPELASTFLNLESRSRRPGENSSLPTMASTEEEKRSRYEKRMKAGLDSKQPDEALIYTAISRKDFDKARKMIDKLSDATKKKQLTNTVDEEEAINLVTKGDVYEAETLAGKLTSASSIVRVYPILVSKCIAKKDQPCANRLVYQALRLVKSSDASPPSVPEGIPASTVARDQKFDPILSFIAKLAIEIHSYSDELAFYVLDEFVSVANTAEPDQARIGFDVGVFKKLAPKNDTHTQQAAYSLRNPVQRVLALAAIYQWKVKDLIEKQEKAAKTVESQKQPIAPR